MPVGVRRFNGNRLTEARTARGIHSSRALADILGRAPSTVGRWEVGESSPEPSALADVARALSLPEEFFLESRDDRGSTMFFRSFVAALKSSRAMQRARLLWLADVAAVAEHYAVIPPVDLPDLLAGRSYRDLRDEDFERLAGDLREHWGLGLRPVDNVVALLERIGVIVAAEHMDTDRLDGLSFWAASGRPCILLANDKQSYARRQFDAAHELAHLVLHRGVSEDELVSELKLVEAQADKFASAFLLPAAQYSVEVQAIDLYELERLKVRWKVSIKAQIFKLRSLDLLSEEAAASLFKRYSAKGYTSKGEPYDNGAWPLQRPVALADIFSAVVSEGGLSKEELLADFCLSANDVESLSGLPQGWFAQQSARVIELRPRQVSPASALPQRGEVVRLERK